MLGAATLLMTCTDARNQQRVANHPFVGEHADASAVHNSDGTLSMRLGSKPATYNKHEKYTGMSSSGEQMFIEDKGLFEMISDAVLGGPKQTDFHLRAKADGQRRVARREGATNKRLGQANFSTDLKNTDGFMWTGEIYMGRFSKMDVVYDTGSDWLTIEGADCATCEGNTYDIQPSVDSGQAKELSTTQSMREYGSA